MRLEEEDNGEEDKEEEDTEIDKEEKDDRVENSESKQVTDKAFRRWVQAYVACFNMDKTTIKHAMETASDKSGIDLKGKKAKIRQFLTEEMGQQLKTTQMSAIRNQANVYIVYNS